MIPTLIFAAARLHQVWWERQPLSVHLRSVFKESGFSVPEYVSEISGSKGYVDFQGDFIACVSFTVRPGDIDSFVMLPSPPWRNPSAFLPLDKAGNCGDFEVPAGTLMIEEWEPGTEYMCKYAVDREANRVYFYRASW
ncbi:hypothetical protein OJ996_23235 [Luteolibacter sp. GHJ8]|uniref:Uncharacterized protein n=1 Tax=Luteolibacter rhizosphaerae TaxID=2989719 RepID=A0ABT3GBA9_9BACT|nr:hypothetical protein [Luteolibacter rhizosphaerae]MCW1916520.1 hypothetical protein [Luteolibacter rhizosphaerae]